MSLNSSEAEEAKTEASALWKELFVDMESFFDPELDYDFKCGSDSATCFCREEIYPDGNTCLGFRGWRCQSSPGEWPVSFHGTSIEGPKDTSGSSYKVGPCEAYGRGIYSTPDISVVDGYTKEFTCKNGKMYKVIMQNRINREKRKITVKNCFCLIEVPEGTLPEMEKKAIEGVHLSLWHPD